MEKNADRFHPKIYRDHRIAELWGVKDGYHVSCAEGLRERMVVIADKLELTVVNSFSHSFEPFGLSVVLILAESHLAVHTWPEHKYLHLDVFTCSPDTKLDELEKVLQVEIPHREMETRKILYD